MMINILGRDYTFEHKTDKEDANLIENNGYCDFHGGEIVIKKHSDLHLPSVTKDYKRFLDGVIRHEIIHAFLFESGLKEYAQDETLVEWMALQFPKIQAAIEQAGLSDAV